jgi:hypothetical protein
METALFLLVAAAGIAFGAAAIVIAVCELRSPAAPATTVRFEVRRPTDPSPAPVRRQAVAVPAPQPSGTARPMLPAPVTPSRAQRIMLTKSWKSDSAPLGGARVFGLRMGQLAPFQPGTEYMRAN